MEDNQDANSKLISISASNASLPQNPNICKSGIQGKSQALASYNNAWSQLMNKGYPQFDHAWEDECSLERLANYRPANFNTKQIAANSIAAINEKKYHKKG
jgi:hypothetical protein